MPSRRTVRTTPPPPGSRPSVTSGRPIFEPLASRAMRWWVARAISRPPPSAAPLIADDDRLAEGLEAAQRAP